MTGFAIPVVLFTISLGGALAVGGAFVTRQMATSARAQTRGIGLDGVAEEWAVRTLAGWDSAATSALPVGASRVVADGQVPTGWVTVWVTRTASDVYLVVVEVRTNSKPLLRRRLGLIAVGAADGRLRVPPGAWVDLP